MSEYPDEPELDYDPATCGVCGSKIGFGKRPWLAINRIMMGTGKNLRMIEVRENGRDDGYEWSDTGYADGKSLIFYCWPDCFVANIDGDMAECDFDIDKDRRDGA